MSISKQRSFAHSIAWNLAGSGIPLAFAFVAIPLLLSGYGNSRFGFLTIAWSLIGYFSIFDFGIGRALTKVVAGRLASNREDQIPGIVYTALLVMAVLGVVAAASLIIWAPSVIELLKINRSLFQEGVHSIRILSVGIPFVILSAGIIGLMEAYTKFQAINAIRLIMGLLNFAAPLITLQWSHSLVPATIALVISRILTCLLYFSTARRLGAIDIAGAGFQRSSLKELLNFGGWITISNLISPLMSQLDKVVIGGVVALSLLPYYSVPGDLVNRLSFVPIAMIGVFFPSIAAQWESGDRLGISQLYTDATKVMLAVIIPISLGMYALAPEGLSLWVGRSFAEHSVPLLRWLCLGLIANAIARIPHATLQAIGRPGITAKLHMLEFPIYAVGLWVALKQFGILGAAVAWTGRMALDLLLLTVCAGRIIPIIRNRGLAALVAVSISSILIMATNLIQPFYVRIILCLLVSLICFFLAFRILLRIQHRH